LQRNKKNSFDINSLAGFDAYFSENPSLGSKIKEKFLSLFPQPK